MTTRDKAAARMVEILDSPFLRTLTEPARLEILRVLLVSGPGDIASIAARLPQDRSVISRHLKTLEDAGIVRGEQKGRQRIYDLDGVNFITTLERILAETRALATICCPPAAEVVPVARLKRRS